MSTKLIFYKQERGATCRFHLTISSKANRTICPAAANGQAFLVDNYAKVAFRVAYIKKNDDIFHDLRITIAKEEKTSDLTCKLHITCKLLSYSKEWICDSNWSTWIHMGDLKASYINDCYLSSAEVCITVYRDSLKSLRQVKGHVQFFEDTDFTDFRLSAEDGSVDVHKAYLAAHSDVFKAMLTNNWKETDEGMIELKGVTLQTLKHLKEYLYLGTLPEESWKPLLLLATQYCIEDLKAECITKLALTVLPENVKSLLEFACDYKIPDLCMAITHLTPEDVIQKSYVMTKTQAVTEQVPEKSDSAA